MKIKAMNTHTSDYPIHDSLQETQEGILGKMILISRVAIAVLVVTLASISLWAILHVG